MTLTERAEAACTELFGEAFQDAKPGERQPQIAAMERALKAAYPELHAAPPRAWIAPWNSTRAMDEAVEGDLYDWNYRFHLDWDAARDAHLSGSATGADKR